MAQQACYANTDSFYSWHMDSINMCQPEQYGCPFLSSGSSACFIYLFFSPAVVLPSYLAIKGKAHPKMKISP